MKWRAFKRLRTLGTSLVVQWLRLCASTARSTGLIPDGGTNVLHAFNCSQKKKKREGKKEKTGTLVAQRIFSFNSPSTDSMLVIDYILQLPRWHNHKESACQCRRCKRHGFDPWVGKIPWSRKWQPTLVFLRILENSMGRGAWWDTVYGVIKSRTRLSD